MIRVALQGVTAALPEQHQQEATLVCPASTKPARRHHPPFELNASHPSLDEIEQALGTRHLRCLTRRDGLISAYCGGGAGDENSEALKIARACGIALPDEALPLRGPVLFLAPPNSVRCHARKSKP